MSSRSSIEAGQAFVRIFGDDRELHAVLKRSQARLQAFGKFTQRFGRDLLAGTSAAIAPIALATKSYAKFSDQMLTVAAVTGSTERGVQATRKPGSLPWPDDQFYGGRNRSRDDRTWPTRFNPGRDRSANQTGS